MIISTSGYYSTGSSAVYALLEEYDSCSQGKIETWQIKGIDYEQALLYTPNGLFDLADKLIYGNSIHRSDEAIRSFRREMERLYRNNYIWIGGYQYLLGKEFMNIVDEFIEEICQYCVPGHWEYHYGNNKFNMRKLLGSIKRIVTGTKIIGEFCKMPSFNTEAKVYYSFIKEDEFFKAASKFITQFLKLMKGDAQKENLILNHFLLPHNLYRVPLYFGDDFRIIVVDRDPRDVFVMEKYRKRNDHSLLPCDDVKEYVSFWRALREAERKITDNRIIRISFEDLIYKYEETISKIEQMCSLKPEEHSKKGLIFDPIKSSNNTQLFKLDSKWNEEINYIEQYLSDYLYEFPEYDGKRCDIPSEKLGIIY